MWIHRSEETRLNSVARIRNDCELSDMGNGDATPWRGVLLFSGYYGTSRSIETSHAHITSSSAENVYFYGHYGPIKWGEREMHIEEIHFKERIEKIYRIWVFWFVG